MWLCNLSATFGLPGADNIDRKDKKITKLQKKLAAKNSELEASGYETMKVTIWEAAAVRLYTGPVAPHCLEPASASHMSYPCFDTF